MMLLTRCCSRGTPGVSELIGHAETPPPLWELVFNVMVELKMLVTEFNATTPPPVPYPYSSVPPIALLPEIVLFFNPMEPTPPESE